MKGSRARRGRDGFTMVEILVVAVIIAILLSLVSTAVFRAITTAREAAIATESNQLTLAMQGYKTRYSSGGFPPTDLRNPQLPASSITKYVRKLFPRYDVSRLQADLDLEAPGYPNFDPGYAMVFWMVGFSGDPANPFRDHASRMSGSDLDLAHYSFEPDRLVASRYFPPQPGDLWEDTNGDGAWNSGETFNAAQAWLYFDRGTYKPWQDTNNNDVWDPLNDTVIGPTYQGFTPYRSGNRIDSPWYNATAFQLVSAGLDKKLGLGGAPPAIDQPRAGDDADNITNFTQGATMGDFTDK